MHACEFSELLWAGRLASPPCPGRLDDLADLTSVRCAGGVGSSKVKEAIFRPVMSGACPTSPTAGFADRAVARLRSSALNLFGSGRDREARFGGEHGGLGRRSAEANSRGRPRSLASALRPSPREDFSLRSPPRAQRSIGRRYRERGFHRRVAQRDKFRRPIGGLDLVVGDRAQQGVFAAAPQEGRW